MRSLVAIFLFAAGVAFAAPPKLTSPQAILIDADTGAVLFEKDADTPTPPGSQSKLLTAYRVFEKLADGDIKLARKFAMGKRAAEEAGRMTKQGGGSMFLEQGEKASVEDLIRGLIVLSANDAALVLAEGLSGTEANFGAELNHLAHRLGMSHTTIMNASGWPHPAHMMSARDLSIISRRLILDFPDRYHYFGEREFLFKPEIPGSRDNQNKLLWIMPGADGLMTAYTGRGGHGIAASIKRGNRRLIAVVNGLKTPNANFERFLEAKALFDYGFREFGNFVFWDAGAEIARVPVWFGARSRIAVGSARPVAITAPTGSKPQGELSITYLSPAVAPIRKGAVLGAAVLIVDGEVAERFDLVALDDMRRTVLFGRTFENIRQLALKIWRQ